MITWVKTGETFNNRKEAKLKLGKEAYNKAVKEREFSFHDNRDYIPFSNTTEFIDNLLEEKRRECIEKGLL